MSSWGEVSFDMVRGSLNFPTKSAIIGMLAAALGITRDREREIKDLNDQLKMVLAYEDMVSDEQSIPGKMSDFYRIDTFEVMSSGPKNPHSYWEMLQFTKEINPSVKVHSKIGRKDYLTDSIYYVWFEGEREHLEKIKTHLLQPKFVLYAGRKNCPFSLPLEPDIVAIEEDSFYKAFQATQYSFDIKKGVHTKKGVQPSPKLFIFENMVDYSSCPSDFFDGAYTKQSLRTKLVNINSRAFSLQDYFICYVRKV